MSYDIIEPLPGEGFGKLAPMITSPLPLFKGGRPQAVRQQKLTNCPLPALLAAMANANPGRLRTMVQQKRYGTARKAWFLDKEALKSNPQCFEVKDVITIQFQHQTIEMTPFLYADAKNKPRFGLSTDDEGWVSYIEKAYVMYRGDYKYENLNFLNGRPDAIAVERVIEDVAHGFDKLDLDDDVFYEDFDPVSFDPPPGQAETFQSTSYRDLPTRGAEVRKLKQVLKNVKKRATVATTHNHTKAVLDYANGKVTMFDAMRSQTFKLTVKQFLGQHDAVYQVR